MRKADSRPEEMGTFVDGVPTLKPSTARDLRLPCFAGALEAALSVAEYPMSFGDILGVSGLAFRTRWRVTSDGPIGCPCSPVGECESVWKAIEKTTGWQIDTHWADGWQNAEMQRLIPDIIASIEGGMPALAIDKHLDSAVIYGHIGGRDFLLHTYYEDSARCSTRDLGQRPAGLLQARKEGNPLSPPEAFRIALAGVVESWHKESVDDDPPPYRGQRSGKAALEAWIDFLDDFDELADTEEPARHPLRLLANHLWAYQHLHIARREAAAFLQKGADLIESETRDLVDAGAKYRDEARLLESMVDLDEEIFLTNFHGLCQTYFSGAWNLMSAESWTRSIRERVRSIMQQSLELEYSAIRLIESALHAG